MTYDMTGSDLFAVYDAMLKLHEQDKSITNIIVDFQIKPIQYEKKSAMLNVTTFTGVKNYNLKLEKNPNQKPYFYESKRENK